MSNADNQDKSNTTAVIESDDSQAKESSDTKPAKIDREEHDPTRPSSTAEVAKELDQPKADDRPSERPTMLFPEKEANDFRHRWTDIQTDFVDEPRKSVERADELVAEVIKRLAKGFAEERSRLEGQWGRGDDVSTEDLRVALRRYRGFFDRLLNI